MRRLGIGESSHMAYSMRGEGKIFGEGGERKKTNGKKMVKDFKNGAEQQKKDREKCNVQHRIYTAAWTASRVEDQS